VRSSGLRGQCASEIIGRSVLSATSIEAYFRSAAARLYDVLDMPPFYVVLHPTDPAPWFNYARPLEPISGVTPAGNSISEEPSPSALRQAIADLRGVFVNKGLAPRFEFVEEFAPALDGVLLEEGYVEHARMLLLACGPATLRAVPSVPGLKIAALAPEAATTDWQAFLTLQQQGFGEGEAAAVTEADADQFGQGLRAGNQAFVATLNDVPAGVAGFTVPVNGLTELVGITTLQAFRGRGIGAALTAHAARAAFDRGVTTAFLVAENHGAARVYERAGFAAYATALAYGEG
jgi:ribosomal protein S18 acetylase RimI-like enzyme